jgi:hypothetical protein
MTFADRFDAKRAAGWSPVRQDGSRYSASVDDLAGQAEAWGARACGATVDARIFLHGDPGWDFETTDKAGQLVRVDVIHIGHNRSPKEAHLIVNPGNRKLKAAAVYLVVANTDDFWFALGAIHRDRFLAEHERKDFGFGVKLALPVRALDFVRTLLPRFVGTEFSARWS